MSKYHHNFKLILSLVQSVLVICIVNARTSGNEYINSDSGIIRISSDEDRANCTWNICTPNDTVIKINLKEINFGHITNHGCVIFGYLDKTYHSICSNNVSTDFDQIYITHNCLLVSIYGSRGLSLWLNFSSHILDCSRDQLQCITDTGHYRSTDTCIGHLRCQNCKNTLLCSNSQVPFCLNYESQRCDAMLNCPKGEDELNCTTQCVNRIQCPGETKCIGSYQICDGITDCRNGFDENCLQFCEGNKLNDTCVYKRHPSTVKQNFMFLAVSTIFLTFLLFLCLCIKRFSNRRHVRRLIENPPEIPLPPFQGPGENDSNSSERFSDSEFKPGGEIYEGFVEALTVIKEKRKKHGHEVIHVKPNPNSTLENRSDDDEAAALRSLIFPDETFLQHSKVINGNIY